MRKVISFLGTAVRETAYSYQGQVYRGGVFQVALRRFLDFDEMLVFVTDEARRQAYPALAAVEDPRIRPVDIRTGTTSEGLWSIFGALVDHVHDGDRVIFDITHGLRSIPFLVFLAAAYLRSAKSVAIEKVLYGALELGKGGPAPVIELTEFVTLLDWLTATELFVRTGNASFLAGQLAAGSHASLAELSLTVGDIALGLHLLRPAQVSRAAARLPACLETARQVLPPPFALVSDRLLAGYGRFGLGAGEPPRQHLARQLEMINWYHAAGQVVHTLSLGREWLVSLLCVHFGVDVEGWEDREEVELLLAGGKIKDRATGAVLRESRFLERWRDVPDGKRLRRLWGDPYHLANVRNDVLHSGFRRGAKSAGEIIALTGRIVRELNGIARDRGLLPGARADGLPPGDAQPGQEEAP
jgi:CRISPR-associated DxTHG motif protein